MKSIILVALALVAVAVAAPAEYEPAKILESAYEQQPDGSYAYNYKTEDGVSKDETGELRDALDEDNKPHKVVVVRGTYSYPGEDGKPVFVNYYADETGFHAEGETIPKPARR